MSDTTDCDAPAALAERARPSLREVFDFGSNPGNLRMHVFVPGGSRDKRALVVVLHGCRQTAHGYDLGAGWSRLAEAQDFLVLYPEQQPANNRDNCFSWFEPERGRKEIESIRQMIEAAVETLDADPRRTYICGLSAGGAMTGAMLAAHPELFAGGAVIAGLPFGTAQNLSEAYESMSGRIKKTKAWGDLIRTASNHRGAWPSVTIWHGTADKVVNPINAGELVKQWTNVHGVGAAVPAEDHLGRTIRRTWHGANGDVCVTEYSVPGLAHGAPVDEIDPPAPFFLPAGISSTRQIARDWGLAEPARRFEDATHPASVPRRALQRGLWSRLGFLSRSWRSSMR